MDVRRLRVLALACALTPSMASGYLPASITGAGHGPASITSSGHGPGVVAATCAPTIRATTRLRARIDSLLALDDTGKAVALMGSSWSRLRYLPRDGLTLLAANGTPAWSATLPAYITPPGISVGKAGSTIDVVVDHAVLLLDPATGRVRARHTLDMQAVGWPAAVATDAQGRLYAAGQPDQGWEAVVESLSISPPARPARSSDPPAKPARVAWRTKLGLFHAGIWLAPARPGYLAVYQPGAYDAPGTVALLNERNGALGHGYPVPAPPLAADPMHNRLYLDGGGVIRALALDSGRPVAALSGTAPLAVIPQRGLVALTQGNGVTLATAITLRPVARLALPGVTALAATPNGALLLLGLRDGVARVALGGCGG